MGWLFAAGVALPAHGAGDLTAAERHWIDAATPVLRYARAQQLPLDIIVQPQPAPGETPVGLAFIGGRCKLVLSMRGNPAADEALADLPRELVGPVVEAMAAHELGHCWRHVQGRWRTLPEGLRLDAADTRLAEQAHQRHEEAFADLVGLAWAASHHPARYAEVQAWQARQRGEAPLPRGPHDTLAWVRLVAEAARFAPAASIFEQAEPLWIEGLRAAE